MKKNSAVFFAFLLLPTFVWADDFVNSDEEANNAETFILDVGEQGNDITLQFGSITNKRLSWDSVNLRFNITDTLRSFGNLEQDGNVMTLDADNSGSGSNTDIVANQGTDNPGTLRYDATANEWQASNDGGAFEPIIATPQIAQVYQSGFTDFNASTAIPWNGGNPNTRIVDSLFTHSTATNPSRVTVTEDGLYEISYTVAWDTNTNSRRTATCQFAVDGTVVNPGVGTTHDYARNSTDDFGSNSATFFYSLLANQYYEIQCQSTGTPGEIRTLANQSWTTIQKIR